MRNLLGRYAELEQSSRLALRGDLPHAREYVGATHDLTEFGFRPSGSDNKVRFDGECMVNGHNHRYAGGTYAGFGQIAGQE